jgi:glycine dehydrogenase subunit 2
MEMGREGERGILVPQVETKIKETVGSAQSHIPAEMRRRKAPALPELSQPQVLRHYLRLSQETLGMEFDIHIGEGTSTMKYSPKLNEHFARQMADIHPIQSEDTIQGILEVLYKFGKVWLSEISGMDEFSFQAGGGAEAAFTNACIIRKHHELNGELKQRNEIITTMFSHPCDAASPATAGFKIITLYPEAESGRPSIEALKAAVSQRTAGLMITNPEDTGIFNPEIDEWTKIVHDAGGICAYDQANANAILGITRAKEAGFDLCFFNLHKTFSSPHAGSGPGCGAIGAKKELAKFLPVPVVTFDGSKYHLEYDRPDSVGKIRDFYGNVPVVLRAYAWAVSMGADGLRETAEVSMINQNYLDKKLLEIRGVSKPYNVKRRIDQARYSLQKMKEDTGLGIRDLNRRLADFGIEALWQSHHPWVIPEPFTPEPCETYSKADLDYWVAIMRRVCEEAYADAETVRTAPHNSFVARINEDPLDDPERWAMTWRAYLRKLKRNASS